MRLDRISKSSHSLFRLIRRRDGRETSPYVIQLGKELENLERILFLGKFFRHFTFKLGGSEASANESGGSEDDDQ